MTHASVSSPVVTKTGDQGQTVLATGDRVWKDHSIITAIGDVDELNCWIGTLRSTVGSHYDSDLAKIQNILFDVGRVLSGDQMSPRISLFTEKIEKDIADINKTLSPTEDFVLPCGNIHIARAVCRRAERSVVKLHYSGIPDKLGDNAQYKNNLKPIIQLLNRLSDYLYTLARCATPTNETWTREQ